MKARIRLVAHLVNSKIKKAAIKRMLSCALSPQIFTNTNLLLETILLECRKLLKIWH